MKIIGITGKSGSGKTTLASYLSKELNCQHIDIDKIGHEAIYRPEVFNTLIKTFGNEILDSNGNIDRKKIGNNVFSNKQKMDTLTDITWDYMQQKLDLILSQENEIIILDWILLPKSKYWDKCACKILVISDDIMRKSRILKRDNISKEYLDKREASSLDYSQVHFDYIFENTYQEKNLLEIVNMIKKGLK